MLATGEIVSITIHLIGKNYVNAYTNSQTKLNLCVQQQCYKDTLKTTRLLLCKMKLKRSHKHAVWEPIKIPICGLGHALKQISNITVIEYSAFKKGCKIHNCKIALSRDIRAPFLFACLFYCFITKHITMGEMLLMLSFTLHHAKSRKFWCGL